MTFLTNVDWVELSIQWLLTCLHFLWQACAVAIGMAALQRGTDWLMRTLPTSSSEPSRASQLASKVRYGIACTALATLPVCALMTIDQVHRARGSVMVAASSVQPESGRLNEKQDSLTIDVSTVAPRAESQAPALSPHIEPGVIPAQVPLPTIVEPRDWSASQSLMLFAPYLLILYALGVVLLLVRFSVSLLAVSRMTTAAQRLTDSVLIELIQRQAKRLGLKRVPIVAICQRVTSPVVVGLLRPAILLPPTLLCGLDPNLLAAIVSHEMAHIRRYDLFFNLLQRIIEALFFFHPATWWISRRVSIERENCCDDLAAQSVGRLPYAIALLQLATLCLGQRAERSQELDTLAADGGRSSNFGYRVRRLIDADQTARIEVTRRGLAVGMLLLAMTLGSLVAWGGQAPPSKDEPSKEQASKGENVSEPLEKDVQWSTWGPRDGLLSGARVLAPEGRLKVGQPLVVEYRIKNVSKERQSLTYYTNSPRDFITIGDKNRISDAALSTSDKPLTVTIEPGKQFVDSEHLVTIDTRGLEPGKYEVALGSAFFYHAKDNADAKHEIPHRGSIPLVIEGEPTVKLSELPKSDFHWGSPVAGLRLGARYQGNAQALTLGTTVKADLWIANVTNQAIECSILLPHTMDGWLFNVEDESGNTIMLERPIPISIFQAQRYFPVKLAPGEIKAITGEASKESNDKWAGPPAQFELASTKSEDKSWSDYKTQGRLVTQGGNYSAIFEVTLKRPDIPGLRVNLDSGNYPFTVGQAQFKPMEARVLDKATDRSILWGEARDGLRLGIRQADFEQHRTSFRLGEHINYEVWLKNETNELVTIARDPRYRYSPRLTEDRSINVVGSSTFLSFSVPAEVLAQEELVLPPGHAGPRYSPNHTAVLREPGSERGRYGLGPVLIEPGRYPLYAEINGLTSGVEEIDVLPAARLQVRKATKVTDESRKAAAQDPSDQVLAWQTGDNQQHNAIINLDHGVLLDDDDLIGIEVVPVEGQPGLFNIQLQLRPEAATAFPKRIASYSMWEVPDWVAVLLDGKPISDLHVPAVIPEGKLILPASYTREKAEGFSKWFVPKPGIKLSGSVKMPSDEWLFRRLSKSTSNLTAQERPIGFQGDTLDPLDGRVVHELTWKDVISIDVTIKAGDGREYSKTVRADEQGGFVLAEPLPPGSYQVDASAQLTLDEGSETVDGEPNSDLRAGTQLIRVEASDRADKSLELKLYPVGFSHRLRHADPTKRTAVIAGRLTHAGQPVPNAKVVIYGGIATRWKLAHTMTNSSGQFLFENLRGDYFGVQIEHPSLVCADGENWRDLGANWFAAKQPLNLELTPGGFVAGQLLDAQQQPRANVPLRIYLHAAGARKGESNFMEYSQTDSAGKFKSDPLFPGNYIVEENQNGHPQIAEVHVTANETTTMD